MWRSAGAVVLGYVAVFALVICGDVVLNRMYPQTYVEGKIPPDHLLMVSTAIFFVASIFGGWLCARMAPARSVLYLFILGEVLGAVMGLVNWNSGVPHWFPISWLVVWAPALWIGMKLAGTKRQAIQY